jgi:hypothetical protein
MSYIDDAKKLDLLWKRFQYGVSQTNVNKTPYEELTSSSNSIKASDIWKQDSLIPEVPTIVSGILEKFDGGLLSEPSVSDNNTWIAVADINSGSTDTNRLRDFVDTRYGPYYEIKVYTDSSKTNRLFNSDESTNWIFDYSSGILWFPEMDTSSITNIYIEGWRYIGSKGLSVSYTGEYIDVLLEPTSGSYASGFIPGWEPDVTRISDAIDQLNQVLNSFAPVAPVKLSDLTLEIPGSQNVIDSANVLLSEGFTDNTNGAEGVPSAGSSVERVVGLNLSTSFIGPFGNGHSGSLTLNLNNNSAGSVSFDFSDQSGTYTNLEIEQDTLDNSTFTPFYQTIEARATGINVSSGLNSLSMTHSETGSTNTIWFVKESDPTLLPTISNITVENTLASNTVESSGIPHLGNRSTFSLGATVSNLSTDMYLDSHHLTFQTYPTEAGSDAWTIIGQNGLPSILTKGTSYDITGIYYRIDAEDDSSVSHGTGTFKAVARNTNGSIEAYDTNNINFMRGSSLVAASPVEEAGIPIDSLGTYDDSFSLYAKRILIDTNIVSGGNDANNDGINDSTLSEITITNNPNIDYIIDSEIEIQEWNSSNEIPKYEAAIFGGAIYHCQIDFSEYIPVGPDYSEHSDIQYVTFMIQRKDVSQMLINVEGTYSGLWVKMAGIDNLGLSVNGWMDCFKHYEGYGVPGREVSNGCAIGEPSTGGSQSIHVTFGYENSSNFYENLIFVRFALVAGNKITSLEFAGV